MKEALPLERIAEATRRFVAEREWDRFHTPKNLATSIVVEAAELLEIFQFNDDDRATVQADAKRMTQVEDELADVFYYLVRLADTLDVDLEKAFFAKLAKSAAKYPPDKARGTAKKYTDL